MHKFKLPAVVGLLGLLAVHATPLAAQILAGNTESPDSLTNPGGFETYGYPKDNDIINNPTDPEEIIDSSFAQPGAVFPNFVAPGRVPYERFKEMLWERYAVKFSLHYSQLNQWTSDTAPGAQNNRALGIFTGVELIWTPIDRGGEYEGSVVFRGGWRRPIGNFQAPASFGPLDQGMVWSNYEYTNWGKGPVVEDLFWDQWFGKNFLNIRVGNQGSQAVYNFSRFKNARVSFTGSPFAFQEVLPYPTFGFGTAVRIWPFKNEFYTVATVNDMNGDPAALGLDWGTLRKTQFFYGLEFGYRWRRENGEFDHIHLDLFYADERSTRMPDVTPNEAGGGFRIYGEKQIGSWVGFGGYTYNTAEGGGISTTFSRQNATLGAAYLNPFHVRGEVAVGFAWAQPFEDILPGSGQRDQFSIEPYWRVQLTPNVTVTPGCQIVFNPSFNPQVQTLFVPSIKFQVLF